MDETKLKIAFSKIKKDMDQIKYEIKTIKKNPTLDTEVKNEIENYKLNKFSQNIEKEIKKLNLQIKEFNIKQKKNNIELQEFKKNVIDLEKEIIIIKKKLSKDINSTANTQLDIQVLDEKLNELHNIITEKIALENAENKLEMQTELAKLSTEFNKLNKNTKKSFETEKIQNNLNEIAEMLNEKMTIEINTLRLEFTQEMAKLYDRFYNEIISVKQENTTLKNEIKTNSSKINKTITDTKKSKKESSLY